jgi:cyanophycinase-like exopeptidase
MVLAARQPRLRRRLPVFVAWDRGLGLVPGIAVLPHYDRVPEPVAALLALQAPRGCLVVGLDEDTAMVGRNGAWQVYGRARVTVWRGRRRWRYRAGDVFRFDEGSPRGP